MILEALANLPGVAWERTTTRHYAIWSLLWLGQVREASRRVRSQLKAAVERGDVYSAVDLRTFTSNLAWLVDDDPQGARQAVDEAMKPWSKSAFHAQHYYALYALGQIDLYEGDGIAGLRRVSDAYPALRASMLMQIQSVRIETVHLRARCALVAAVQEPESKGKYLRMAESDGKRLVRETSLFAPAMGELTLAAVCSQRGDESECVRRLWAAKEGFDRAGMVQFAAATERRLGARSSDAQELAAKATERMVDEEIHDVEKWTDLLAPGVVSGR